RSVYHPSDADLSVTRIIHGSVIIEMRGTRLLVDPWFHSGYVTRQDEPLGLTPEGLPTFSAVLLTHGHADRFDPQALRALALSVPEAVAPPELHERLKALGFGHVTDLDWWDTAPIGGVVDECGKQGIDRARIVLLEPGESWHYYRAADAGAAATPSP